MQMLWVSHLEILIHFKTQFRYSSNVMHAYFILTAFVYASAICVSLIYLIYIIISGIARLF